MSCYNSTVPSSSPLNATVTSVNPASLRVSWQQLPIIYHNGPLTGHVIQYTRVGSNNKMNVTVTNITTHIQGGLVALVNYSVRVAAINVNGTGPFSVPVVGISGKGKLNLVATQQCVYIIIYFACKASYV